MLRNETPELLREMALMVGWKLVESAATFEDDSIREDVLRGAIDNLMIGSHVGRCGQAKYETSTDSDQTLQ